MKAEGGEIACGWGASQVLLGHRTGVMMSKVGHMRAEMGFFARVQIRKRMAGLGIILVP